MNPKQQQKFGLAKKRKSNAHTHHPKAEKKDKRHNENLLVMLRMNVLMVLSFEIT